MKKYVCDPCGYVYDPEAGDPDGGDRQVQNFTVRIPRTTTGEYTVVASYVRDGETVSSTRTWTIDTSPVSIAEGKKADFITINIMQPHLYPTGNLVNTLLECVTASDVCDMVVDGRLLMKNREIRTLDEEKIFYEAMKYMEELEA